MFLVTSPMAVGGRDLRVATPNPSDSDIVERLAAQTAIEQGIHESERRTTRGDEGVVDVGENY
jgi:hypothetical protein